MTSARAASKETIVDVAVILKWSCCLFSLHLIRLDHEYVYKLVKLVIESIFFPFRLVGFLNSCGMSVNERKFY